MMDEFLISKDRFCKTINQLRDANDLKEQINHLIFTYIPEGHDFLYGSGMSIDHEQAVVDLLTILMHDETELISYWIYECDYYRTEKYGLYVDDKKVDLSTPEKLYDYLLEEYNKHGHNERHRT